MSKKRHSYGVLLYRLNEVGKYEIFLCKANGVRYWGAVRTKIWGIPKGRPEINENPMQTAMREFFEETGNVAPDVTYSKLIDFDTPHDKIITVFIGDATGIKGIKFRGSNTLEAEYPAGSGIMVKYPEIAAARWFTLKQAGDVMMWGQKDVLPIIKQHLDGLPTREVTVQAI
jgi:predicted NUDIX family NTP pyrophosphohydrolase